MKLKSLFLRAALWGTLAQGLALAEKNQKPTDNDIFDESAKILGSPVIPEGEFRIYQKPIMVPATLWDGLVDQKGPFSKFDAKKLFYRVYYRVERPSDKRDKPVEVTWVPITKTEILEVGPANENKMMTEEVGFSVPGNTLYKAAHKFKTDFEKGAKIEVIAKIIGYMSRIGPDGKSYQDKMDLSYLLNETGPTVLPERKTMEEMASQTAMPGLQNHIRVVDERVVREREKKEIAQQMAKEKDEFDRQLLAANKAITDLTTQLAANDKRLDGHEGRLLSSEKLNAEQGKQIDLAIFELSTLRTDVVKLVADDKMQLEQLNALKATTENMTRQLSGLANASLNTMNAVNRINGSWNALIKNMGALKDTEKAVSFDLEKARWNQELPPLSPQDLFQPPPPGIAPAQPVE